MISMCNNIDRHNSNKGINMCFAHEAYDINTATIGITNT